MHPERRRDGHREMLIEVALRLQRFYGYEYAKNYLVEMNISSLTIDRILSTSSTRKMLCNQSQQ